MAPKGSKFRLIALNLGAAMLLSGGALAATPATLNQLQLTSWTRSDGMPGVLAIAQDSSGILWLGAREGVFRFDGRNIVQMSPKGRYGDNFASAILAARDGTVWVGYRGGRIELYRDGRFIGRPPPATTSFVMKLRQAGDGAVWAALGRPNDQLVRWNGQQWDVVGTNRGLPPGWIIDLLTTRDGAVVVTTLDAVFRLPAAARRFVRIASTKGHAALAEDATGQVWASDETGTRTVFPLKREPSVKTPPFPKGASTIFDRHGNLWGAPGAGIFRASGLTLPDRTRSPAPGKVSSEARRAVTGISYSVFEDREGNVWAGTTLGLSRLRSPRVVVEQEFGQPLRWGYAIRAAADGGLLIGADDSLWRQSADGRRTKLATSLPAIMALCEGPAGEIWVFHRRGLARVTPSSVQRLRWHTGEGDRVYDCAADASGGLLIASQDKPLTRRAADGSRTDFPGEGGSSVIRLFRDARGTMYAASEQGIISEVTASGLVTRIRSPKLNELVSAIATDRSMLVSSLGSLTRVRGTKMRVIAESNYPWLSGQSGLERDVRGNVWTLGRLGLVRLSPTDLDVAFERPGSPLRSSIYDSHDGMPDLNSTDGQRDLAITKDGRVWLATLGGIAWVDLNTPERNEVPPGVVISALISDGERTRDPVRVELPAGSNSLEIDFMIGSLKIPDRVSVRYRLEGVDKGWVNPEHRRQAFYTNLPAGAYRFQVIAANDDGVWNRQGATLEFTLAQTFVETIWFKLICGIGVLLAGWGIYSLRLQAAVQRVQRRADVRIAERERIAREIHDTVLQGFQGLVLMIQSVANKLPSGSEERPLLETALDRADAVLAEGRDKVRELRTDSRDPDIARSVKLRARGLDPEGDRRVIVTAEGPSRPLRDEVFDEAEAIATEALRNAFQHSGSGEIQVSIASGECSFRLIVQDCGVGFDPDMVGEQSFGIIGMRERAVRIGGRLTIESCGGTVLTLEVPASAAYVGQTGARKLLGLVR